VGQNPVALNINSTIFCDVRPYSVLQPVRSKQATSNSEDGSSSETKTSFFHVTWRDTLKTEFSVNIHHQKSIYSVNTQTLRFSLGDRFQRHPRKSDKRPPLPNKQCLSIFVLFFCLKKHRNPSNPWTSGGMVGRHVWVIEQFWCPNPLTGSEDVYLFHGRTRKEQISEKWGMSAQF
jgi:hypothetical protein